MKIYVASRAEGSFGHVTCASVLRSYPATLLVSPNVRTLAELQETLAQLSATVADDLAHRLRHPPGAAPSPTGAMGSIAISYDARDIAGTRREGPIFGSSYGWPALVALAVDDDLDVDGHKHLAALIAYALDPVNEILTPLPRRRTIHHATPHSWGPDGAPCGHHESATEQVLDSASGVFLPVR